MIQQKSINKNILGVDFPVTLTEEDFLTWMILNKGISIDSLIMPFIEALNLDDNDVSKMKLKQLKEFINNL